MRRCASSLVSAPRDDSKSWNLQQLTNWVTLSHNRLHVHGGFLQGCDDDDAAAVDDIEEQDATEAGAVATLITPPPTAPSKAQTRWTQDDIDDLENVVLDVDPDAVNLSKESMALHEYWLADGMHPTPVGQIDIPRSVLNALDQPPTGSPEADE